MNVSDQVGLARSSDGVLRVAWRRGGSRLFQTPIASSGEVSSPVTVVSGWASLGSPALVGQGPVLSAFFPGVASLTTGDPTYGLDMARSVDGGASWVLNPVAITRNEFAFARTPAAGAVSGWVQAWSGTDSTVVHTGLDPNVPPVGGYGSGTDQALASASIAHDQAAQVMVAWCTELTASTGVVLARVDPCTSNGAPIGDVAALPDTGRCPADTRIAPASFRDIPATRPAASLISTPPPAPRMAAVCASMWSPRAGSWRVQTVAGGPPFKQQIAIATGPRGRVWVAWRDSDTGDLVFRRSDPRAPGSYTATASKPGYVAASVRLRIH